MPDGTSAGILAHLPAPAISGRWPLNAATAIKVGVGVIAPLAVALAALGGIGSFATVRHLAVPWFGPWAWIVPVGIDIGILALLAWDLLAEAFGLAWSGLRWVAWAYIATTVDLNIAAAHGNRTAALMHAAMPVLFITITEGARRLIRQLAGIANGTRFDRTPSGGGSSHPGPPSRSTGT
jgi:hypothetical protein